MSGLIAIVGATGIGKSTLALKIADSLNGEIINADSRQVYRYMNIGTAKPSTNDFSKVRHHLFDVADPDDPFNLAIYLGKARKTVEEIRAKRKLPILVGGSGLYVWGLIDGLVIPAVPPDLHFRADLEMDVKHHGYKALYQRLEEVDSVAAMTIDPRNVRRVIRALEVFEKTGMPFSSQLGKNPIDYPVFIIGLSAPRVLLYQRIDDRVEKMMDMGFLNEVEDLLGRGYSLDLPSMLSVGYKQIGMYLRGECSVADAVELTKTGSHRLARHQGAWFKSIDPRITWFDITKDCDGLLIKRAEEFILSYT